MHIDTPYWMEFELVRKPEDIRSGYLTEDKKRVVSFVQVAECGQVI